MKGPQQNKSEQRDLLALLKTIGKRSRWLRFALPICAFALGVILVGLVLPRVMSVKSRPQERPISDVLTMADHHALRSVTITGNDVLAISTTGQRYYALKEDGQVLTEIFRRDGILVTIHSQPSDDWTRVGVAVALLVALGGGLFYLSRRGGAGAFRRSNAQRFNESQPSLLFKDVAGVEEAKQELQEIVEFLQEPRRFLSLGARLPKGALLVGAPGTGKTLLSRAVAGEAGVPFYSISGSEFVEVFAGVGAARVRDLFHRAKAHAPCLVFIDEIDAVGRQRSSGSPLGNEEREQTLNQLLVELDGFDTQTNIVVMAATNRPDILDQALLRPGRFDRQVILDHPDIRGRLAILEVHAQGKPLGDDVSLHELARQTAGFSGADLANLLNEAALLAARQRQDAIHQPELEEAILRVMAGPERKSRLITAAEKAVIAHHEVGHAIVMRSLPGSDPVQKVQAIARGMALGVTLQAPAEDRYLMRRSELLARMAGAMGGRAAEEIIFGDITTGASQDIEYVTSLARRMVCELGMSPLGPVALKMDTEGRPAPSPETAAKIDREMALLVEQAHATALHILQEKKERLIAIAERLIEVETLDGSELDAMLRGA